MNRTVMLVCLALTPGSIGIAQGLPRVTLVDTAVEASRRLSESSGVAVSQRDPGVYWTHNDSGDGPFLYATDAGGRDLGWVRVSGASATDWEDLAAGPCVVRPGRCLYVGDIGDNRGRRPYVVVYRLVEPEPPHGPSDTLRTVSVLDSVVMRYPDRPHDAEALVVTRRGDLMIITKELTGPALLFVTTVQPGPAARTLRLVGPLDLETSPLTGRLVTGAALSPDDSLLVVRTYVSLHFFLLAGNPLPRRLGPRRGLTIPVVEPQGEAVTFERPDLLVLTSERGDGDHALVARLRLGRGTP